MVYEKVLIIAGSDSSGGAGLEADQKVLAAHGCYAMTATTALTAQNTRGVTGIHLTPTSFVKEQIDACFDDIGVDVVKTGMLASAETTKMVADVLKKRAVAKAVVDPVMVATTGAALLPDNAMEELRSLAKMAYIITPNIPELKLLLGHADIQIDDVADFERLAQRAHRELASTWLLAKGGHLPFQNDHTVAITPRQREVVVNVLVGPQNQTFRIESKFQNSTNTHGTGCSLASAIAANIARGMDVHPAVVAACRYTEVAIANAPGFGNGHGPLNHFHSTFSLPFSRGHFLDYVLERPDVSEIWQTYIAHPFLKALGNGTLPLDSFKGYLVQDYLYLTHFARATALASYKSKLMKDIVQSSVFVQQIGRETDLHLEFCSEFNITKEELDTAEEHTACIAYSRYILDIGQSEDWFALQIALAPCTLGYGMAARLIADSPAAATKGTNPYWRWVQNYAGENYDSITQAARAVIEDNAARQSPSRIEQLVDIFVQSTKMEIAFWEMFSTK